MSKDKNLKCRNMEYVQQISKMTSYKSLFELIDDVEAKLKPKKFAGIVHDQDVNKEGNLVDPHVHVMMSFENARSITNVAKILNDDPQYIKIYKGNCNNGYSYLVHRTKGAITKHQYDPSQVIANFDYPAALDKIREEVMQSKQKLNVPILLDALYDGSISKEEIEKRLTGSQYARAKRQIDDIWNKRLKNEAEIWRTEMIAKGQDIKVLWLTGPTGVGKTRLAIAYAKKMNRPYYLSGSSRDIFERYASEKSVILDECRPSIIPYHDLLRILDPFGEQVMAPSRYHDKALACDLIIITSPYNPLEFYRDTLGINDNTPRQIKDQVQKIDSFEQLLRRITLIIEINDYWINPVEYDKKQHCFVPIPNTSKQNPYSSLNRPTPQPVNKVDLFNKIFD